MLILKKTFYCSEEERILSMIFDEGFLFLPAGELALAEEKLFFQDFVEVVWIFRAP